MVEPPPGSRHAGVLSLSSGLWNRHSCRHLRIGYKRSNTVVDIAHIPDVLHGVFEVVVPPPETALAKPV